MQILFNATTKKYIKSMRFFSKGLFVIGETLLFQNEILRHNGKWCDKRKAFLISEEEKASIEAIIIEKEESKIVQKTIKDENNKDIVVDEIVTEKKQYKLKDYCKTEFLSDPTPEQTVKRVGKNYLGEDLSKYIIVSMPNDIYLSMETEIRQAKDIKLGLLPAQHPDGSYLYQDDLLTIIPPDPPTAEEIAKEEAEKNRKINLANAVNAIKNAPDNPTSEQKTNMMFDYIKNTIG
jgi:hypothetical protein